MPSLKAITAAIRKLEKYSLLVGIPADKAGRETGTGHLNNAELLYLHTFGVPEKNIPARPSIEPGIERSRDEINKGFKAALIAAVEGSHDRVTTNLDILGTKVSSAIRNVISEGIPPPLSPRTVAARRRRSKGSKYRRKASPTIQREFNEKYDSGEVKMSESPTTPLDDTGQMMRSITHVVRIDK